MIVVRRKIKWKNVILALVCLGCFVVFCVSLINIFSWKSDSNEIKKQVDNINQTVDIIDSDNSENVEIIKPDTEVEIANPYWDYINMKLIDVDFTKLKKINNDVVGWIQVVGTNVNYPFVQTNNNDYYLTHAFDKTYNKAGWVFMDYRNNKENFDKNVIIYAHSRYDDTMFGSLSDTLKSKWYNDSNNHIIKLSTEKENTMWQIFSIYRIPTTSDYLQIDFNDNNDYLEFLNMLKNRSERTFKTGVSFNDEIITLSTCYNEDDKLVIHAKLIKKEIK